MCLLLLCRGLGIIWISGPRGGPLIVCGGGTLIYKGWTPLLRAAKRWGRIRRRRIERQSNRWAFALDMV